MKCFIECKNVECRTEREEIFTDLQLIIKDNNDLYKALDNLMKAEELIGENAYQTEKYGKQASIKG